MVVQPALEVTCRWCRHYQLKETVPSYYNTLRETILISRISPAQWETLRTYPEKRGLLKSEFAPSVTINRHVCSRSSNTQDAHKLILPFHGYCVSIVAIR